MMFDLNRELSRKLNCGNLAIQPYTVLTSGKILPDSCNIEHNTKAEITHVALKYGDLLKEDLFFYLHDGYVVCRRSTANVSGKMLALKETGLELKGMNFSGAPGKDYFYHVENPRIYSKFTIPVDLKRTAEMVEDSGFDTLAGNRWADPGVVSERIGASPYQPFPAILLSNYESAYGLVHGSLSQQVFFHNYLTGHRDGKLYLDILASFKSIGHYEMQPGKVLDDLWYLGRTEAAADIERIFSGYVEVLKQHLPPMWGSTNINRHSLVWGSWNDGIFRKIDQERLLKTADFLAENFPMVKWMQIDDGYARRATDLNTAHGLGMPYEGEAGVAKEKFPEGLKVFADKVRERGIRPAVWIGGFVPHDTPLFKEHPEWFLDYSYRVKGRSPLDVSKPEVREYMEQALDYFFKESGFEGMKHDFWSYAFEDSHDLLANKNASGYEYRDWWLKEIRKRIPADAYLQTGCDIVMANPFLGQYFTNYRYGIDIGSGNWEFVKTNFLWGTACFALHVGELIVPNSDSVGLFPDLSDEEALLCINYCLITRSMVEVAGWLYDEDADNPRFKFLRKAICCPNNGQEVFFAGFNYRETEEAPAVWYLKSPHFSLKSVVNGLPLRTVAIFNISDEERDFVVDFKQLDLNAGEYLVTDVWNDATELEGGSFTRHLKAHDSILLAVSATEETPQVLDANLKIDAVCASAEKLDVAFGYGGKFTLTLSKRPVNAEGTTISVTEGKNNWLVSGEIAQPGTVSFKF
ncbi:MAG: alpha-galactosidase [Victivallaceae bacterium]